jgi:hypothetical protein
LSKEGEKSVLSIRNAAALTHVLDGPIDPKLKLQLQRRYYQLAEYDLADIAYFLIVRPGDAEADIIRELGFSPLMNLVEEVRFPSPDFEPSWECIEDHGGWFELTYILSDDGFGYVLLVQDAEGVDPDLLALCRQYASM